MMEGKDKVNYIFGVVTISAVIGFTYLAIREYKRMQDLSDEIIDVEQARREIEIYENEEIEDIYDNGETGDFREELIETSPEDYEHPQELTEEDFILRHEPNSDEAREQFINMELADWDRYSRDYETLLRLYSFPFMPIYAEDIVLKDTLVEHRRQFFGDNSKWNKRVTYADLLLYFGRELVFEYDETLEYWVEHFLENMGVDHMQSSTTIEEILQDLNNHVHYSDNSMVGLFGLTDSEMDDAYTIALNNDEDMSYRVQFNEFLKKL